MAKYSEREKERLIQTPITEVLAHYGKDYRPRGKGMYLSPLRDESVPSFHVNQSKNTWYDFGLGEGGGIVDLVCRLSGCDRRDALDTLSIINGRYPDAVTKTRHTRKPSDPADSPIEILRVERSFTSRALIAYAESRGISKAILDRQCQEVTYCFGGNRSYRISAIGFMNDLGGYSLRNSRSKRSNSSYITTIGGQPGNRDVLVFEGFFDYLSHLTFNGILNAQESVCVLNGVGNVQHSLTILEGFSRVFLYLDNDEAGRRTADTIAGHCTGKNLNCDTFCQVHDMSHIYRGYNDYNSMLMRMAAGNKPPSNYREDGNHSFKGRTAEAGQDQLGEPEGQVRNLPRIGNE